MISHSVTKQILQQQHSEIPVNVRMPKEGHSLSLATTVDTYSSPPYTVFFFLSEGAITSS